MFLISLSLLVFIEVFNFLQINHYNFLQINHYKIFIYLFIFSLVGSIILLITQFVRLTKLNEKRKTDILFYDDVIYSIYSVFIIYIFCLYQNFSYVFMFFTLAISSLLIYLISPTKRIQQMLN
jgi:hypothetical protein